MLPRTSPCSSVTIVIYDNAVRSTKIARVLNFMNRLSELYPRDTELIAYVLRRIPWLIPNHAGHAQVYNSRADQSLSYWALLTIPQIYSKAVKSTPCLGLGH